MRRAFQGALAAAFATCASAQALSQPAATTGDPGASPAYSSNACVGARALDAAQAEACRAEFRGRVEADRVRVEAWRAADRAAREVQAARRRPQLKPREASVDFFLSERLSPGDVVMTDKGPRVYIGAPDAAPRREDFVTPGDPRAPRRRVK